MVVSRGGGVCVSLAFFFLLTFRFAFLFISSSSSSSSSSSCVWLTVSGCPCLCSVCVSFFLVCFFSVRLLRPMMIILLSALQAISWRLPAVWRCWRMRCSRPAIGRRTGLLVHNKVGVSSERSRIHEVLLCYSQTYSSCYTRERRFRISFTEDLFLRSPSHNIIVCAANSSLILPWESRLKMHLSKELRARSLKSQPARREEAIVLWTAPPPPLWRNWKKLLSCCSCRS